MSITETIDIGIVHGGFYIRSKGVVHEFSWTHEDRFKAHVLLMQSGALTGNISTDASMDCPERYGLAQDFDLLYWLATTTLAPSAKNIVAEGGYRRQESTVIHTNNVIDCTERFRNNT